MKTAKDIESEFRKDFKELLAKYNAEFDITDDGAVFGMQIGQVDISIPAVYGDDNDVITEFCEFKL